MGMLEHIKIRRMFALEYLAWHNALELLCWGDPSKYTEIKRAIYTTNIHL
jgi:hypothetical protein